MTLQTEYEAAYLGANKVTCTLKQVGGDDNTRYLVFVNGQPTTGIPYDEDAIRQATARLEQRAKANLVS